MLSGMTIGYWTTNWCAPPWGRLFLLLSAFLNACSSLCRVEASWAFPHPLWPACRLCSAHIYAVVLVRCDGCSFRHYWETQSHSKVPILWLSQSLCSPLPCPLSLRCRSCIIDISRGTRLHNSVFWVVVYSVMLTDVNLTPLNMKLLM